jgi:hypothetical protein
MQKLLRKAATTLYAQGQLDFDSMHNYLMSGEKLNFKNISYNQFNEMDYSFQSLKEKSSMDY